MTRPMNLTKLDPEVRFRFAQPGDSFHEDGKKLRVERVHEGEVFFSEWRWYHTAAIAVWNIRWFLRGGDL